MKVLIDDINIGGYKVSNVHNVLSILNEALSAFSYECDVDDGRIVFHPHNDKYTGLSKFFTSKKYNALPLAPGDPRRIKLKRQFLNTRLLTRWQERDILSTIRDSLLGNGVRYTLVFQEYDEDDSKIVVDGNVWPVEQKTYALQGEAND